MITGLLHNSEGDTSEVGWLVGVGIVYNYGVHTVVGWVTQILTQNSHINLHNG